MLIFDDMGTGRGLDGDYVSNIYLLLLIIMATVHVYAQI